MADTTVEKLATEVGKSVERLIEQFSQAGIKKGQADKVTEAEKQQLLDYLKKQHGGENAPTKMTLQRKTVSTLSVAGNGGQSKDVKVEGKALKAGKYGIWTIPGEKEWTIIFNSKSNVSGTAYSEADDVLRVKVKPGKSASFTERLTFTIAKTGLVSLAWGDHQVNFSVK